LNEFQLIHKYFSDWSGVGKEPALGIGDDAALVQLKEGRELVVAADTLVAGRHFPEGADPAHIASRALRVNLSDMAAMGATPLHYTLCLTLPESNEQWLHVFATKLREDSQLFDCSLIGGDTTRGPLCISLQMLGTVEADTALKRSAAQIGDQVWVTGSLGDAAGYIALNFSDDWAYSALADRFWSPEPRVRFASAAKKHINACIDISDGLLADLGHICKASELGANVRLDDVPVSEELLKLLPDQAQSLALTGGDDYELCFTAAPAAKARLQAIAAEQGLHLALIGSILAGSGVSCLDKSGSAIAIESAGYSHF
jgi:thiamine-monophosphate kinase